jgi:CheY-like chemotaxis protein
MTALAASNGQPPEFVKSDGFTVLVVEDEENLRTLLRRTLQSQGYGVLEAANGAEALLILEEKRQVHIVVTDLRMPVMDGRQLASVLSRLHCHTGGLHVWIHRATDEHAPGLAPDHIHRQAIQVRRSARPHQAAVRESRLVTVAAVASESARLSRCW